MALVTLYRATTATPYVGVGSCWTPDAEAAEAYTDNPGFGGPVVVSTTIEPEYVLDLSILTGIPALRKLAEAIEAEDAIDQAAEWHGNGLTEVFHVLENAGISKTLGESYSWIVYRDDYPAGCITWMLLDSTTLAVAHG